jgi:hypothetical protein
MSPRHVRYRDAVCVFMFVKVLQLYASAFSPACSMVFPDCLVSMQSNDPYLGPKLHRFIKLLLTKTADGHCISLSDAWIESFVRDSTFGIVTEV